MSEFKQNPREGQSPQPAPAPRPSRRSALLLWVIAGAGLVLISLFELLCPTALAGLSFDMQSLIYNLVYYLGFVGLPVFLLARRREGLWQAYRPYPISFFSVLSIVALALLGVFFFTDLSALWSVLLEALGLHAASVAIPIPTSARGLALCVLYTAVLPAVCEEFLFRGAILSGLEGGGTKRAVLLTSLMFALLHGSLIGLPMQFLVGTILGWLVVYCDSIYAGLIYHTTHNAATILLEFALNRSAEMSGEALPEYSRMIDAVGGRSGLVQLLAELAMLGVMMFFSLRMFRLNARLRGVELTPHKPWERARISELALLLLGLICAGALYGADLYAMALGGGA